MRKGIILLSMLIYVSSIVFGQGVGIGTSSPDPSARLDIVSTTSGFLTPRMTSAQRLAIPSPATGLMLYDTDLNQFMIYDGSSWTPLLSGLSGWMTTGNSATDPAVNFIGTIDNLNFVTRTNNIERMRVDTTGAVGIGQPNPDIKSILDINSTTRGIFFPRMNTTQRLSIINNGSFTDGYRSGLTVYDSTLHATMQWNAPLHQWDTLMTNSLANGLYWKLLGNTGTDTNINYLGTTDSTDLIFRTNGIERLRIRADGLFYTGNQGAGASSIFLGGKAGSVSTGSDNSGIGLSALKSNTTGTSNSALGSNSLQSNTTGSFNTATGFAALASNTTGSNNTAMGDSALFSNTTGNSNIGLGEKCLKNNTTAYGNTGVGKAAMTNNQTGYENIAMGDSAMSISTDVGSYNISIGANSSQKSQSAVYNVVMGYEAQKNATLSNSNITIGYAANRSAISSGQNVSIGSNVMTSATSSFFNVGVGYNVLQNDLAPTQSIGIGAWALGFGTGSNLNIAIGNSAMAGSMGATYGSDNMAIGNNALYNITSGSRNVAMGDNSMIHTTTGKNNVAVGADAMYNFTVGNYNTVMGDSAMANTPSVLRYDSNTIIGYHSSVNTATAVYNSTALGAGTVVDAANSMRFGNNSTIRWGFGTNPSFGHALQVGTTASNGNGAYLTTGGVWTNTSDRNLKTSIEKLDPADVLNKINQLDVSRWEYIGAVVSEFHIGPMAQDFHRLFNVGIDDKSISTIDPAGVALIGVQALSKNVEALKAENGDLKKQIELLKARLDAIENGIDKK